MVIISGVPIFRIFTVISADTTTHIINLICIMHPHINLICIAFFFFFFKLLFMDEMETQTKRLAARKSHPRACTPVQNEVNTLLCSSDCKPKSECKINL